MELENFDLISICVVDSIKKDEPCHDLQLKVILLIGLGMNAIVSTAQGAQVEHWWLDKGYFHYCSTWAPRAADVMVSEQKIKEAFHLILEFRYLIFQCYKAMILAIRLD